MTVKELKEKLEQFPDNCIVLIPNENKDQTPSIYVVVENVARGVNEMDGCVIIDAYIEEKVEDE